MSVDGNYENHGGIYFKKDQIKYVTYGGGLNGTYNVTLKNGALLTFKQQNSTIPRKVLDSFPIENKPAVFIEDGRININKCDLDDLEDNNDRKDHYVLTQTEVNRLNIEEQDICTWFK